ncbi:hypothetical protein PoB_004798500, partial [Plakobranchus ocellatus]
HQKKSERDSHFMELLFSLCQYIQELLLNDSVKPIKEWSDVMEAEWDKVYKIINNRKEVQSSEPETRNRTCAFHLLLMHLGFQLFADYKTASELLPVRRTMGGKKWE